MSASFVGLTPCPAAPPAGPAYRATALAVVLVLLAPLAATRYAPIVDYPNHLARTFVLHHYGDVPAFATAYVRALVPIPNVAIDVIVSALQYVLPPVLAGKMFLLGVVLLWCWGCHLLGRAIHGRPTWLALPCMLLAYHGMFQYGFVNYSFGLGVYLVGLATWLARRRRWTAGGLALTAALATLAYLSHLSAYALFGVSAVVVTVHDLARRRTTLGAAVAGGLPFVPPLMLFAAFMRRGGQVGGIEWNGVAGKAIALFSVVRGYDLRVDLAVVAALGSVVTAALVAVWRRGRLTPDGPSLATSLVLFVLFILCPSVLFTSGGADVRVVPPAVVLGILAWHVDLPRRTAAALLGATLVLLAARTAAIGVAWRALDDRTARTIALLDRLPEGASLLPLFTPRAGLDLAKQDRALEHAPFYPVITRRAYVPLMFAVPAQQPIVARHDGWSTTTPQELFDRRLDEFQYVWTFGQPAPVMARLRACCDSVAADAGAELWRVRPRRTATSNVLSRAR